MPQRDYIDLHRKCHGYCPDHFECKRKKKAFFEILTFKTFVRRMMLIINYHHFDILAMHEESSSRLKVDDDVHEEILSNSMKQKRKEEVSPVAEDEIFKVLRIGKRKNIYSITYFSLGFAYYVICSKAMEEDGNYGHVVGTGFRRKPKYERFIRPIRLRFTKGHVIHHELKCTFNLEIIRVKKNPNGQMYTSLGHCDLGLVTPVGKVVWVTNDPKNDGCINVVLLV
ncbi:hypothetical protein PVL29_009887 [Vitis rotundifolia]|uniref:Uncharacterized protein n=1 Tax=Vitis rotundifolia TaxID=103349 RepID=A0AA39DS40_VITRO|nr:hypothetical protein PVL29_009887 [Vitis rotundifolia]